jgi:hypothetical protein
VTQTLAATNAIASENIQSNFRKHQKKNPHNKKEWKDASIIQLFDLFEEKWLMVGKKKIEV